MSEITFLVFSWISTALIMLGMVQLLRKRPHPIVNGIFIAFWACLVDAVCLLYYDYPWVSSFRSIPLLAAGFFGTPLTAGIAGVLSAVGVAVEYFGVMVVPPELERWLWIIGSLEIFSTLLVTGYAIAVKRYIFDNQTPNFIQAGFLGSFGEIIHVGTTFLITGVFTRMAASTVGKDAADIAGATGNWDIAALGLEFIYSFYPGTLLGAGVILAAVCLLAGGRKTWQKDIFAPFSLCVLLFGGVTFFVIGYSEYLAYQSTAKALTAAREKLIVQIEDQIGYMLHRNAVSLRDTLAKKPTYSTEAMQRYAALFDVNEINIFSKERRILASNLESVIEYNRNGVPGNALRDFFELCSGKRDFVKNHFRASRSNRDYYAKYIGVPFADRSAFLQMGYSWEHLLEEFPIYFFPMFDTARIGNSGYFVVTDLEGTIVAPVAGHKDKVGESILNNGLKKSGWQIERDTVFEANLFGEWSLCSWSDGLEQYRVFAVIPNTEYFTPAMRMAIMILFLLFVIAFLFRVLMLRNAHTQAKLDAMRKEDMDLASSIQNSELNKMPLDTEACFVTATMTPAREVGGDFFDYCRIADGRIALVIADVSGKGIPAAFVMMKARTLLESCICSCNTLSEAVQVTNARLQQGNRDCMFVTAWVGLFDAPTGQLEFICAGHNPPFLKRANGEVERLKAKHRAKPLALFAGVKYESETLSLHPGDTLYLYTDGVTEAMNRRGELYGEARLEQVLRNAQGKLIEAVTEDLDAFTGKAPQADDITMLTLEVKKDEPNR